MSMTLDQKKISSSFTYDADDEDLLDIPDDIDTWSESDYKIRDYYKLDDELGTL